MIRASPRPSKHGWYKNHEENKSIARNSRSEMCLTGDSIANGLARYPKIWKRYFCGDFNAVNFGMGGDRTQHTLWRTENGEIPTHVKYVVIHCGTNNIGHDAPKEIANGVFSIGLTYKEKRPDVKVLITGLLPRDEGWSFRRDLLIETNVYLKKLCSSDDAPDFYYMPPPSAFSQDDGTVDKELYYDDLLHLSEAGNNAFGKAIYEKLRKIVGRVSFSDDFAIGEPEILGKGWDGPHVPAVVSASPVAPVHAAVSPVPPLALAASWPSLAGLSPSPSAASWPSPAVSSSSLRLAVCPLPASQSAFPLLPPAGLPSVVAPPAAVSLCSRRPFCRGPSSLTPAPPAGPRAAVAPPVSCRSAASPPSSSPLLPPSRRSARRRCSSLRPISLASLLGSAPAAVLSPAPGSLPAAPLPPVPSRPLPIPVAATPVCRSLPLLPFPVLLPSTSAPAGPSAPAAAPVTAIRSRRCAVARHARRPIVVSQPTAASVAPAPPVVSLPPVCPVSLPPAPLASPATSYLHVSPCPVSTTPTDASLLHIDAASCAVPSVILSAPFLCCYTSVAPLLLPTLVFFFFLLRSGFLDGQGLPNYHCLSTPFLSILRFFEIFIVITGSIPAFQLFLAHIFLVKLNSLILHLLKFAYQFLLKGIFLEITSLFSVAFHVCLDIFKVFITFLIVNILINVFINFFINFVVYLYFYVGDVARDEITNFPKHKDFFAKLLAIIFLSSISVLMHRFNYKSSKMLCINNKRKRFLFRERKSKKSKMFFILPKIFIIILCVLNSNSNSNKKLPNAQTALEPYDSVQENIPPEKSQTEKNMALFALSKLKLRKYDSFFKFILLLSGDINLHPGPIQNPCKLCSKSVNQKVIFCQKCNFWFHKKCEIPDDKALYNELKLNKNIVYLCRECSKYTNDSITNNPFEYLPFFGKNFLEDNFDMLTPELPVPDETDGLSDDASDYKVFENRGLHFVHINANSIISKIEEVRLIAHSTKVAVIGITESKLDNTIKDSEISIPGYNILRSDRNRNGGGVMCYIKDTICFNRREDFSDEIENVFVDLLFPDTKPILLGFLYRPPDQPGFLDKLSTAIINTTNFDNQEVYILGDLNMNLIYSGRRIPNSVRKYREFCALHGLSQLIEAPTRITKNTATLLDHVLTNCTEKVFQVGSLDIGLSDHHLIYCTRKKVKAKIYAKTFIKYRSMKKYSKELLLDKFMALDFDLTTFKDDVNMAYANFVSKLNSVIDEIAPIKEMCVRNNTEEWVNEEVFEAIRVRDKKYKTFKRTKLHKDHVNFRNARTHVKKLIRKKKRTYIKATLADSIGNPKELWKNLKKLGLSSKDGKAKICLGKKDDVCFDAKENAETFKNFYANLANDLLEKLPPPTNKFGSDSVKEFYKPLKLQEKKFSFNPCTEAEVLKLLNAIDPSKSVGLDNLGGKFLKEGAESLAHPICQLINMSIEKSIFPDSCKIAKLIPLFKKGSALEPKNYRPISLLPLLSKLFEKIAHEQTQKYLDENNIIYKYQSGFRAKHSTDTCLSLLNDKILSGMDDGLLTGMVLIDLQKAFDTIDHEVFFSKMAHIGFSSDTINWYKSYLNNRTFLVNIEKELSSPGDLACGVPQGSILGPLIFLLYVNDMSSSIDCDLLLYADDSCLIFTGPDIKTIESNLNRNFESLCDWFVENKLSIHFGEDKTKSILFGSKMKLRNVEPLDIRRGDTKIKQYTEVTYLGCKLDQNLSGESMATKVLGKINGRLKFLYRKQAYLSKSLRRLLCNALMQPHFDYASSAWYPNLNKKFKKKMQIAQNKCIRFCLSLENRAHLGVHEFKEINWLPTSVRFEQCICSTTYKFCNDASPVYMSDIFGKIDSNYNTRRSTKMLLLPRKNTSNGQKGLSYLGPKYWNILPSKIKLSSSTNAFKHAIKSEFFEQLKKAENDPYVYTSQMRGRFSNFV